MNTSQTAVTDRVRVAGVGATQQGKLPGRTADDLAVEAVRAALADAGLDKSEIDALVVQRSHNNQGDIRDVGHRLGIMPSFGFNVSCQLEALHTGIMLIATGLAQVVVLAYGTNQRTDRNHFAAPAIHSGGNYGAVYGLGSPASTAGLIFRRRMHLYGDTEEQLGALTVAQSRAAALNPLAVYRDELTLDDYLAAPLLIAPLRLYDFCMISDGGFATVLVSAERAADLTARPVRLGGVGYATAFAEMSHPDAVALPAHRASAARLWSSSEFGRADIDLMYVQDPYTPVTLAALEAYGFCGEGEAASWIQGGRIELGGQLPVNVNGGQNRMTYMVGWQHTYDAVRQVRGQADTAERQVAGARTALVVGSSGVGQQTGSFILTSQA